MQGQKEDEVRIKVRSCGNEFEEQQMKVRIEGKQLWIWKQNVRLIIPLRYMISTGLNKQTLILFLRGDHEQQEFLDQDDEPEDPKTSEDQVLFQMIQKSLANKHHFESIIKGGFTIQLIFNDLLSAQQLNANINGLLSDIEKENNHQDNQQIVELNLEMDEIQCDQIQGDNIEFDQLDCEP